MSASAIALARFDDGRAHAVQAPFWPSTARPQARTAPPYSSDAGSAVLYLAVRAAVVRPSDEPPGQVAPASQERSSHTSSPARPPLTVPQAMPAASRCKPKVRPFSPTVLTGSASVPPAAPSHVGAHNG